MAFQNDDISINTLMGAGSFIRGNLSVQGFIRFDGDIDGDLETTGRLIIGEQARVRGNVVALSAIIHGIVEGDIMAPEGIRLFSTASITGDVVTKNLFVEEKVFIQGECIVLDNDTDYSKAKNFWQEAKAIREKSLFASRSNS